MDYEVIVIGAGIIGLSTAYQSAKSKKKTLLLEQVIVIGAGIIGLSTAYQSAKSKKKTLLLEQFLLPHSRGSSHGPSRLTRKGYDKDHNYGEFMDENSLLWTSLEQETNTSLFQETGLLFVARPPYDHNVEKTVISLKAQNISHQRLDADGMNQKFPTMKFDPVKGDVGVYEPSAGVLKSNEALACFQKMFLHYGGDLKDGHQVIKITPKINSVVAETNQGRFQGQSLIITAGPWTSKLTSQLGLDLPLQPKRIKVCYWRQRPGISHRPEDGFPCFIADGLGDDMGIRNYMYGLPAIEYPQHVKICSHYGQPIDPDDRDKDIVSVDLDDLCTFVGKYFPGLQNKPSIVETCIITITPDEDFIIDRHPKYPNVVIGAGFSGRGFKLSPIIGKLLSQLANGTQPAYNLDDFSVSRFQQETKAKL